MRISWAGVGEAVASLVARVEVEVGRAFGSGLTVGDVATGGLLKTGARVLAAAGAQAASQAQTSNPRLKWIAARNFQRLGLIILPFYLYNSPILKNL
jgi:poly(3-hydroxybutyrate) depolymerase